VALYGNNLAATIRAETTWGQADDVLQSLGDGVRAAYASLDLWSNWKERGTADTVNLAILQAISPDDQAAAKSLLDSNFANLLSIRTLVQDQGAAAGFDSAMSIDYVGKVGAIVGSASDTIALVDKLFHTSVAQQVSDQIVPVVGDIGDKVANGLSKLVGNFLAGAWWVIALGLGLLYLWHRWGHKVLV
jgi:hypothetical protein